MAASTERKIKHLYHRAGFGLTFQQLSQIRDKSIDFLVDQLFKEAKQITPLEVVTVSREVKANFRNMTKEQKREIKKAYKENIKQTNTRWLEQMASSQAQLREKMTLFWHGHFACTSKLPVFNQIQNNTIRKHALGKFGDLLKAVSKDPAMLQFLNNQQNRKQSPNENFAREVLELFTLGRGNYSEQDIKEAARAFTGWGFNLEGEFVFREAFHDFAQKTFMGRTGNFNGEDILNIILENKQTALFLTTKIYKYFVNHALNPQHIQALAKDFYESGYDISVLMHNIFTAEWFYDEKNIGSRIKSPVELLANLIKVLGLKFERPEAQIFIQKVLGQVLFYPPNVAGWPEGKSWIDSSTLLFRLNMTAYLITNASPELEAKEEGDVDTQGLGRRGAGKLAAQANLNDYYQIKGSSKEIFETLQTFFLQTDTQVPTGDYLKATASLTGQPFIHKTVAYFTSLPEFQMC